MLLCFPYLIHHNNQLTLFIFSCHFNQSWAIIFLLCYFGVCVVQPHVKPLVTVDSRVDRH